MRWLTKIKELWIEVPGMQYVKKVRKDKKNATMKKEINIQGLKVFTVISPWERYEDSNKV